MRWAHKGFLGFSLPCLIVIALVGCSEQTETSTADKSRQGGQSPPDSIQQLSDEQRVLLPFTNITAVVDLKGGGRELRGTVNLEVHTGATSTAGNAWPPPMTPQQDIPFTGQVSSLQIQGREIALERTELRESRFLTKEFGEIEVVWPAGVPGSIMPGMGSGIKLRAAGAQVKKLAHSVSQ